MIKQNIVDNMYDNSDLVKLEQNIFRNNELIFKMLEKIRPESVISVTGKVVKREKILDKIGRVRDVNQGLDGYLYVNIDGKGVVKIIPNK